MAAGFDFDELEAAELSHPGAAPPADCRRDLPELADVTLGVSVVSAPKSDTEFSAGTVSTRSKGLSRARAWFEIKRFFEAEPQKYYGSPNTSEWKTYYAKELLLSTTCERLQEDGFVVIDALLSPTSFRDLARRLLEEAPEQADALKDHLLGGSVSGAPMIGWVGVSEQAERERTLQEQALAVVSPGTAGPQLGAETAHDRALCESCLLSLAHDREQSSALRPRSKQQFFRLMRTYLHVVAANSMSEVKARPEEKIPVQFCFGNMPSPKAALLKPPLCGQKALPLLRY